MVSAVTDTYRQVVTLRDGARILLRPMIGDDVDGLAKMYAQATPDDLRSLRHDVSDRTVVQSWADTLDYARAAHSGGVE